MDREIPEWATALIGLGMALFILGALFATYYVVEVM